MSALTDSVASSLPLVAKGAARRARLPSDQQAAPPKALIAVAGKSGAEEPELALEPDLPLDGRDPVGEAMIRDLPSLPKPKAFSSLPEPSRQPH